MASSIVAYLKMQVTLGTLRHQLAADMTSRQRPPFVRRLARQQGSSCSTRAGRSTASTPAGPVQRALDRGVRRDAAGHPRGERLRCSPSVAGCGARGAGWSRWAGSYSSSAALLYLVLGVPRRDPADAPARYAVPVPLGLLALLVILAVVLIQRMRGMGEDK